MHVPLSSKDKYGSVLNLSFIISYRSQKSVGR